MAFYDNESDYEDTDYDACTILIDKRNGLKIEHIPDALLDESECRPKVSDYVEVHRPAKVTKVVTPVKKEDEPVIPALVRPKSNPWCRVSTVDYAPTPQPTPVKQPVSIAKVSQPHVERDVCTTGTKFCNFVTRKLVNGVPQFTSNCTKSNCKFAHNMNDYHPLPCKYQAKCMNGQTCKFFHDKVESVLDYCKRTMN